MEEKASDLEFALFLSEHIENPCGFEMNGSYYDGRDIYLREAKRALPQIKYVLAKDILLKKIEKYHFTG